MKTTIKIWALAILCLGVFDGYANEPEAPGHERDFVWTPERILDVGMVGAVRVSPEGKRILFVMTKTILEATKSEYQLHTYVANADGTGRLELTTPEKTFSDAQWSPRGGFIAFKSAKSGADNLWLVAPDGANAQPLTESKTDVGDFKWSLDGGSIAFTASDGPGPEEEKAIREKNDARVVDENVKMKRLYVVRVAPDSDKKHLVRKLTDGNYTVSSFDWSPDGQSIAFEHEPGPGMDMWRMADISVVHLNNGAVGSLAHSGAAEMNPLWSPDGRWIAFIKSGNPSSRLDATRVCLVSPDGRTFRQLAETVDGFGADSDLVGWSADSQWIYYIEPHGTIVRLCALPLSGAPKIIGQLQGALTDVTLNASRSCFGFGFESPDTPREAYFSHCDDFKPVQVSFVNTNLPPVARTEVIQWKSVDGLNIEGLLTYPSGYQKGKHYPLLVVVHGGPRNPVKQSYIGTIMAGPPIAAFAERGYAILQPNYRGSSGYGNEFRAADRNDWGGKDFQDILSGVDYLVRQGIADDRNVGLTGWSYGGYMAAWAVTQTGRFRAVSAGALTCDLIGSHYSSAIPSWTTDYFGENVFKNQKTYLDRSPLFHVRQAVTPTLILQGENDPIAPASQAYEFYHALKEQGCPVKMVVYPRTGHYPYEPKLLLDMLHRNLDWFDQYLLKPSD